MPLTQGRFILEGGDIEVTNADEVEQAWEAAADICCREDATWGIGVL